MSLDKQSYRDRVSCTVGGVVPQEVEEHRWSIGLMIDMKSKKVVKAFATHERSIHAPGGDVLLVMVDQSQGTREEVMKSLRGLLFDWVGPFNEARECRIAAEALPKF